MARVYELLSKANEGEGIDNEIYRAEYFENFPQLVPFSGVRIKMRLSTSGVDDEIIKKVLSDLKDCNIEFTNISNINTPEALIQFDKKGEFYRATINVNGGSGKSIVTNGQIIFKTNEGIGKELALRLFGKGGTVKYEALKPL